MRITKKAIAVILTVLMAISMMPFTALADTAYYEKVTGELSDWSGDYLIVYEDGNKAFNGGTSEVDSKDDNKIDVTISNGAIESNATTDAAKVTIEKDGDDYYILTANGDYIGGKSGQNKVIKSDSGIANSITYSDGDVTIISNGCYLRYNKNSGANMFRYYKSDSQTPIQLYKLEAASAPATYTVTWKNYDNTELEVDTGVAAGTTPSYDGAAPAKTEDAQYTYSFAGWSPEVTAVTGDVTYVAQFTPVAKFSVFVKKLTGGTITVSNVTGLTTVAQLKDLLVTETGVPASAMRLIFAGKQLEDDKTLGEYNVQKESTLHLVIRTYTITWKSDEATIIDTTNVAYGETPTHEDPAGYEDADYTYTFAGWTPEVTAVTGEATYVAQYTATPKAATTVSFTKVTDASQITAENIGTCTADEAKAWALANWDDVHDDNYDVSLVFYSNTGELNVVAVYCYMDEDEFSDNFDATIITDYTISDLQQWFDGYGAPIFICTAAAPAEPNNGASITVAETISENFYLDDEFYGETAYVSFTYNHNSNVSEDADISTDVQSMASLDDATDGRKKFSVVQAPAQATEPITINVYANADDAQAGTNAIDTIDYSVYTYCRDIIENYDGEKATEMKALAKSTLDYAAAAQTYFGYNTDDMATKDAQGGFYNEVANADLSNVAPVSAAPSCIKKVSLVVKSDLEINLLSDTPIDVTDFSIAATTGKDRFAVETYQNGDYYVVHIAGIEPANMGKAITINTSQGDIVMTANSVVKMFANSTNANLSTLAKALFTYGNAANAYFG